MSSGASPGYNLFTKEGRYSLRTAFRYKEYAKPSFGVVLRHTFIPLWCGIVGHVEYDAGMPQEGSKFDIACKRCGFFVYHA